MLSEPEAKTAIVDYAKSIFNRGLTSGASANMSVRIDAGWVITPTNTCFGFLDAETLSVVDMSGKLLRGLAPSKEFKLHRAIYEQRPTDRCVVHLHSTYATAWSCIAEDNDNNAVPAYTPYLTMRLGNIATVPYFPPGDDALVQVVASVAAKHPGIIMANHGPIVSANTIEAAVYGMEELEESCKLACLFKQQKARSLTPEQIQVLESRFKKT